MVRQRVRIRFAKRGDLRLLGHRDLVRAMARLFRRAELKLGMSEGFHPKPRMSFPSALALGLEGWDEVMELELAEPLSADELLPRLRRHALPGLEFCSATVLPPGTPKARLRSAAYQVAVPAERRDQAARQAADLWNAQQCCVQRGRDGATVDVRGGLEELSFRDGVLAMRLVAVCEAAPGPRDVLAALGLADALASAPIARTAVELVP